MPRMDQSGPEGKGKETGRGLGKCRNQEQETLLNKLGKGLGLKRKSGGGIGKKKRLKSGE
ncbi:DUF5320 family protein [Marinifilum caeruleilacunae]|uniref:DUF5320 domain-containing protein n=1 Tax=Marinifilum caeruleilacunae TaxID=2499076 RepID=A0ABX1WR22_9BACT|nr:DUF5320 family protein [Marinifilum caeruleilacunae]NOU58542.1 hypothetical protein [Marinifilum caeruleilacunae]